MFLELFCFPSFFLFCFTSSVLWYRQNELIQTRIVKHNICVTVTLLTAAYFGDLAGRIAVSYAILNLSWTPDLPRTSVGIKHGATKARVSTVSRETDNAGVNVHVLG